MKFNRLRLLGFKSFVEPSEFVIERGLTGIVGPNGCGKSNLVEALRWVMGENSYKNMRASGMDDVIFSGSGNRPARNTAEVGLYLDNSDRTAPAAFNDADMVYAAPVFAAGEAPIVAADPPDGLVLDVTGAGHRYGGDEGLLEDLIAQTASVGLDARAALAEALKVTTNPRVTAAGAQVPKGLGKAAE